MQSISQSSRGTAPRVQSAVSRPRRRTHCRALPVARRMQRPLVVQVQPLERLADLAFPPHSRTSSRPQIYQRCVHARRAVEGSPRSAARPMRAQTRAASPPCSAQLILPASHCGPQPEYNPPVRQSSPPQLASNAVHIHTIWHQISGYGGSLCTCPTTAHETRDAGPAHQHYY